MWTWRCRTTWVEPARPVRCISLSGGSAMSEMTAQQARKFNHTSFTQFLGEQRLMAARCTACGEVILPPRAICPRCYGSDMEWVELSGEGRLAGFTIIYVGLPAMAERGYSRKNPYCAGVVHLAEGPAITAQIV